MQSGRSNDAVPILARIAESALTASDTRAWAENLISRYNRVPAEASERMPAELPDGSKIAPPVTDGIATSSDNQAPVIFQAPQN